MQLFKSTLLIIVLVMDSKMACISPEDFAQGATIINELNTEQYIEIIKPFLPNNAFILEAGAHSGEDTVIFASKWPRGTVFGFEPVKKFFNWAQDNVRRHKQTNVKLYPYALFSESGERTFYYSTTIGGASSLLPDNNIVMANNNINDYKDVPMTVQCINLDEWAQKNGIDHIDFMWLDMEGAEYYVLKAAPTILKTVKVIISEINFREFRVGTTQYTDIYTLLTSNGFKLYKIWGSPTWQATALFVRSELLGNK